MAERVMSRSVSAPEGSSPASGSTSTLVPFSRLRECCFLARSSLVWPVSSTVEKRSSASSPESAPRVVRVTSMLLAMDSLSPLGLTCPLRHFREHKYRHHLWVRVSRQRYSMQLTELDGARYVRLRHQTACDSSGRRCRHVQADRRGYLAPPHVPPPWWRSRRHRGWCSGGVR